VGTKVFISYSSKDSKFARAICSALESRGLPCWISSRDVGLGENFMDAIVRAIGAAKVMVLVFSENANNSDDMKREIVLASSAMVTVIPVRVEDVVPKGAFAYQLATRQWIDLFQDWEAQIERLAKWIEGVAPATSRARPSAGPENPNPDGTVDETPRETDEAEARRQEKERERAEQEQAFTAAKSADTVTAIDAFIASYPDSHLAGDARSAKARLLARDEAYRRAVASDDPGLLKAFLNSDPTGSRADEIRKHLQRLETPRTGDPPKPPPNAARGYSKKKLLIAAAIAIVIGIVIISAISSSNQPSYTQAPTSTPDSSDSTPDSSQDSPAEKAFQEYMKR
jgi:TIR domain-containing protein